MKATLIAILGSIIMPCGLWAQGLEDEQNRNWHQWRGPEGNGVVVQADPPLNWSESENIRWKVEIPGKGCSTPIVWNDRVFILTAVPTGKEVAGDDTTPRPDPARGNDRGGRRSGRRRSSPTVHHQFVVLCLDRLTGRTIWKQIAVESIPHEGHHRTATFASCSPITDGRHVYATFGSRGIYCYDMDGKLQWQRDLGDMRTRHAFGEGASPALAGETLIVPWDHEGQSAVFALDTKMGATRWKVDRDEATTWSTPLVVDRGGRRQVVMHGSNRVRSYDVTDGRLIWECGGQVLNPVASPIAQGDLVYCTTGRRGLAVSAMPLSAKGDITGTKQIAWHRTDFGAYVPSPVIYKGQLYLTKECRAILACFNAKTGETIFGPERLLGLRDIYASLVAVVDRIYITDRVGTTLVLQHGTELKVLATNKLEEGADASLAIVGKEILLRGHQHLYCIAEN